MRKVMVYRYEKVAGGKVEKVEGGIGFFHAFGSDYEEFEAGPANFSTAIVEMPDGSVINPSVNLIKFIDPL